jgi:antitoxin CptB
MTIHAERKAKINWRCRRGMLELDLILGRFTKRHLATLTDAQLDVFEDLLNAQDPDLYAWLMGYEGPPSKELADFVAYIKLHDNP